MRAYGRRHRRWRNRSAQPLMIVADESYLVDLIAAIGRLLFRYRSELAPFTTAAVLSLGAAVLHVHHAMWWTYVLGVTSIAVAMVLATGAPFRLDRVSERIYASAVISIAGVWSAAAVKFGPWHDPLPTLLGAAVIVAGLPWWTHRRRRVRVMVDRTIQAWPNIAESIGLAGSRVLSAVVDVWGWRARLSLRAGQTVADVITQVPAIESGLGTRPGAVRVEPDPAHAGRVLMRVLAADRMQRRSRGRTCQRAASLSRSRLACSRTPNRSKSRYCAVMVFSAGSRAPERAACST